MGWVGQVSLPAYARRQVSPAVYAVVTPTILPLADRLVMQRTALEALISEHAAAAAPPQSGAGTP
jgi:hypothetical protein